MATRSRKVKPKSFRLERKAQQLRLKIARQQAQLQKIETQLAAKARVRAKRAEKSTTPIIGRLFGNAKIKRTKLDISDFIRIPGSARRYKNKTTGEEISREARDKLPGGSLSKRGASSFKQAAKQTPVEARLKRPARGRGTLASTKNAASIGPRVNAPGRSINAGDTKESYEETLEGIQSNPKIYDAALRARYTVIDKNDVAKFFTTTLQPVFSLDEQPSFEEAVRLMMNFQYRLVSSFASIIFENFIFYVRFKEEFVTRSEPKPKKPKKKRRKSAKKRKRPGPRR